MGIQQSSCFPVLIAPCYEIKLLYDVYNLNIVNILPGHEEDMCISHQAMKETCAVYRTVLHGHGRWACILYGQVT
jgi:hypothetical protein